MPRNPGPVFATLGRKALIGAPGQSAILFNIKHELGARRRDYASGGILGGGGNLKTLFENPSLQNILRGSRRDV